MKSIKTLIFLIFSVCLYANNNENNSKIDLQNSIFQPANGESIHYYLKAQKLIDYDFRNLQYLREAGEIDENSFKDFKDKISSLQEKVEQDIQGDDWQADLISTIKSLFKIGREFDEFLYEIDKSLENQSEEIKNARYREKTDYLIAGSFDNKFKKDLLGQSPLHYGALLGDLIVIDLIKTLATDTEELGDIFNHLNDNEKTALDLALDKKHYDYAEKLLHEGSKINYKDSQNSTALHKSIKKGSLESVVFLLNQERIKSIKDVYGNTPLHIAAEGNQAEILNILLSSEKFSKHKDVENCFGLTPCQLAIRKGCDQSIKILCDLIEDFDPEKLEGYGKIPPSIDQDKIIENFLIYLELKNRDTQMRLDKGLCNGFSFLAQYYASLNQEDEFFHTLEKIAKWDRSEENNLEEILEQWINDLVWFQQNYLKIETFQNFQVRNQFKRIIQFNLIKKKDDEREIVMLQSPITFYNLSRKQVEELVILWTSFFPPQTIIELGGGCHATSGMIHGDSKISYYDPNMPLRMKLFDNPKELARTITKTKYKLLGYTHGMEITMMAYQYVEKGEQPSTGHSISETQIEKFERNSPNHFTPLHLAIFANDIERFRFLLEQTAHDPNEANNQEAGPYVLGVTPLNLAISMYRSAFVKELLKHPEIDIYKKSSGGLSPLMAAINFLNVDVTVQLLNHGGNLFVNEEKNYGLTELLKNENSWNLIEIPAIAMCMMKQREELDFIRELCRSFPSILEIKDKEENSLLDYAAEFKNEELMKILNSKLTGF